MPEVSKQTARNILSAQPMVASNIAWGGPQSFTALPTPRAKLTAHPSSRLMTRPRIVRLLRIGWSAGCVIACLLLIAMWVRSYWVADVIMAPLMPSRPFIFRSSQGVLVITWTHEKVQPVKNAGWRYERMPVVIIERARARAKERGKPVSDFNAENKWELRADLVRAPHWMFALSLGLIAATPWLRWRFSLRTLLIVTTLVAVVLGVIVSVR